jgi:hypothetical protein
MKHFYIIAVTILLIPFIISAQQASDYFPDQTGFKWLFKVTPLDSANNPVDTETFFRVDSFTTTINYEEKLANVVISKEGPAELINIIPFTDSSFYHFAGTDGYEYVSVGRLEIFLTVLDSIIADSNFSFLNIFKTFENWYSTFRFSANINQSYPLLSLDTTVVINGTDIPLRFEYNAKRLEDDTLETNIGTFACKKFIRERGISFLIFLPPPIPPVPIPIAFFNDSIWIAESNWIVQSIFPSTVINLGMITGDTLTLPGLHTVITDEITGINNPKIIPEGFGLSQNFPNPFNPVTNIQFTVAETKQVNLKVFNLLGCEITTLVDEELPAGDYNIEFDATGLPSGFYIYVLETADLLFSRKMILLK